MQAEQAYEKADTPDLEKKSSMANYLNLSCHLVTCTLPQSFWKTAGTGYMTEKPRLIDI